MNGSPDIFSCIPMHGLNISHWQPCCKDLGIGIWRRKKDYVICISVILKKFFPIVNHAQFHFYLFTIHVLHYFKTLTLLFGIIF